MCALCTCTMYIHESPPGTFILPNYDVLVLALGLYVYVQCQPTVCIISIIHHFLGQETLCHLSCRCTLCKWDPGRYTAKLTLQ